MTVQPLKGTVRGPDGRWGILDGQLVYPETILFPVKPWMMDFDNGADTRALAIPGTKEANTGVAVMAQQLLGLDHPVGGGYRAYLSLQDYVDQTGLETATRDALGQERTLVCLWTRNGTREQKYGNAEMRAILRGERDEVARAAVREIDPTGCTYFALLHEADGYGGGTLNPTLYRMAVLHLIEVMVEEAQLIGLAPNQFGVGGLLTGEGMNESLMWRWWDGMSQRLIDSNMVVCFWDTYFKVISATEREPFREKVDAQTAAPRAAGIKRFVLAETTLALDTRARPGVVVGTIAQQVSFIGAVTQWLQDGQGEGVAFFHSPDGTMSALGRFRGEALMAYGRAAERFNHA
jgi:hypothetical protein